jgi:Predicted membrane protein (DUF2339)
VPGNYQAPDSLAMHRGALYPSAAPRSRRFLTKQSTPRTVQLQRTPGVEIDARIHDPELSAVVLKLFMVDLSRTGTVPRIVSFLGVGVLMLIIGYFSPLPPHSARPAD